jgi:hypothetical protein
MSVRAKFRCIEVGKKYSHTNSHNQDEFYFNVRLLPVLGDKRGHGFSEENKKFYSATPSGEIEMQMVSEQTAARFEPGKPYYVDFTEAPE